MSAPSGDAAEDGLLPGGRVVLGTDTPLRLDCGVELTDFAVAYQTHGELNAEKSNAVLVCHAVLPLSTTRHSIWSLVILRARFLVARDLTTGWGARDAAWGCDAG